MGRRFLLNLSLFAILSSARAQDGHPVPKGAEIPPAPSELNLPAAPDLPPGPGSLPTIDPTHADAQRAPVPKLDPVVEETEPARDRPKADRAVDRAEGASAETMRDASTTEPLPAGRQSVAVTVDVQSPPSMNLHQPANVRLVIRNTGTSDALKVRVEDRLPDGLKFIESDPKPDGEPREATLSWTFGVLRSGSERVVHMKVEPTKAGSLEHGASVWFQTGSSAPSRVYQPRLKIVQTASASSVLKGHTVEFRIAVRNEGDGPARNVRITARLSPGLRYGSGGRGDSEVVTDPIPVLARDQVEELDPLVAEAITDGPANCTVTATSPDVVVAKEEEARSVATVEVVEPKLQIALDGPQRRYTDTVAPYQIEVRNPGTAPARKVRVTAIVPPGVRLLGVPEGAKYDQVSRRLVWSFDRIEPKENPRRLGFEVKVGDVGKYEVSAEANGIGGLKANAGRLVTEVFGMPDVDLVVSERQRAVDVKGRTTFYIRLRNYGTKEATNIVLKGSVTANLKFSKLLTSDGVPSDLEVWSKDGQIRFARGQTEGPAIPRLGPGKEVVIGLEVEVTGPEPRLATLTVTATHDDLSGTYEDMAGVKVLPPSGREH